MTLATDHMDELSRYLDSISAGHVWIRNRLGRVDVFAYASGYCNGPVCAVCHYRFCHHCHEFPEWECPNIIEGHLTITDPGLLLEG